jgi:DNA repair protein RecO (recombination protein O)
MRDQRSYSTKAIVLKHVDLGEADRILTLFTPYKGKFHAIAKGSRRPGSKKAGHLELLCHSQLQVAQGRNLDIITQAQSLESFLHLRSEFWHMTCGFYLAELVDRFVEETGGAGPQSTEKNTYELLALALRVLEEDAVEMQQRRDEGDEQTTQSYDRTQLLLRYFEIDLLSLVGYEPALRSCAHCHAELLPQENGFNASLGGGLCPDCSHLWTQSLSMNGLKVLRILQRTAWPQVPRFHLDTRLHNEIESAMHSLLRFHLERDLKSWSFLEMLHAKTRGS